MHTKTEGLKQATKIELPVFNGEFLSKTRLSIAISHFVAKSRFQQLPNLTIHSLLKIRNTIDINMSPRMLTSDKKFCARSILRAAHQQKLSQDPCVPFPLYNILCADNLQ